MDVASLVRNRLSETYDLHTRCINPQFVRVLEVIGFNRSYKSGNGARLVDAEGERVLDFLAGFSVFNIGRNHPLVIERAESDCFLSSLDAVLTEVHRLIGAARTTTKNLALRTARSA